MSNDRAQKKNPQAWQWQQ